MRPPLYNYGLGPIDDAARGHHAQCGPENLITTADGGPIDDRSSAAAPHSPQGCGQIIIT